jgi:RNA polymerase sigma factor (sigma-70 family)
MNIDEFELRLKALRPRLHRYCARMTGSTVTGEDVLQDALIKALNAHAQGAVVENFEAWLYRIAHNACLDFLREKARNTVIPLTDDVEAEPLPEAYIVAVSFQTFLRLPELQRCAVILKDILGHSIDEVASIADCSAAAAKSALQRGRASLRQLAQAPEDARLPLMSDQDRQKIATFVRLFRNGEFDAIRAMLADDVKLDLVNRLQLAGRDKIAPYFTRYAEVRKWRFALGAIEGRPAMLVFDGDAQERPAHFVLVDWHGDRISAIRDFLFAPYALESVEWVALG